jgi:hypothetical protein
VSFLSAERIAFLRAAAARHGVRADLHVVGGDPARGCDARLLAVFVAPACPVDADAVASPVTRTVLARVAATGSVLRDRTDDDDSDEAQGPPLFE